MAHRLRTILLTIRCQLMRKNPFSIKGDYLYLSASSVALATIKNGVMRIPMKLEAPNGQQCRGPAKGGKRI